jgi:hypothetical protein
MSRVCLHPLTESQAATRLNHFRVVRREKVLQIYGPPAIQQHSYFVHLVANVILVWLLGKHHRQFFQQRPTRLNRHVIVHLGKRNRNKHILGREFVDNAPGITKNVRRGW